MTNERRKLKLLPEVLPAPAPSSRATSPRERTMLHMRRLVAATAMMSAGAEGCSKPKDVTPPDLPPPPGTASATATAPATAVETATAATSEPTAPPTVASSGRPPPPPPPPTYAVVDPMPPPAQCNLTTVSAAPKWVTEGSVLDVVVASSSAQVKLRNPKDSPLSVMGGKVVSADFQGGKVHARVEVDPNAALVVLSVHAQCPGWATLAIKMTIDKAKGRKITTAVDNY